MILNTGQGQKLWYPVDQEDTKVNNKQSTVYCGAKLCVLSTCDGFIGTQPRCESRSVYISKSDSAKEEDEFTQN
jgi:hypothetical protein